MRRTAVRRNIALTLGAGAGLVALLGVLAVGVASGRAPTNEGVGRVRLGMTPQEVVRVIGNRPSEVSRNSRRLISSESFSGRKAGELTTAFFSSTERVAQVSTSNPAFRTDVGNIGTGSTIGAVKRAFGRHGNWLNEGSIYAVTATAGNGDKITNVFRFTKTDKVMVISVVNRTNPPLRRRR